MILKGEKIVLRPIKISDAQRFTDWLCDPEVNMFTTRKPTTLEEEFRWIRGLKKKKDKIHLAIDTVEKVHIGVISLDICKMDSSGLMGLLIGDKKYWNGGYGTDAIITIMDYGFKDLKLHRIELDHGVFDYNTRAFHVYEKIGFVKEGISREAIFFNEKYHDLINMSVLAKEWKKKKVR